MPGLEDCRRRDAGTAAGLVSGLFGVGGGFVIVPALVLILGFDSPPRRVPRWWLTGVDSAAALAIRAGLTLHWALIDAFAVAALADALAGGRRAGRVSSQRLSAAFSVARQSARPQLKLRLYPAGYYERVRGGTG